MIHPVCRLKTYRVMAVFTNVGGLYVRRIFAGRIRAVVTTNTIARDVDVIEIGWCPARC